MLGAYIHETAAELTREHFEYTKIQDTELLAFQYISVSNSNLFFQNQRLHITERLHASQPLFNTNATLLVPSKWPIRIQFRMGIDPDIPRLKPLCNPPCLDQVARPN
jgi:hypothetical protein